MPLSLAILAVLQLPSWGCDMATRVVDTSPQQVHDFFVSKGWSSAQSWGIAGNVKQESGFASNALFENSTEKSYGLFQFNSKGNPAAYSQFSKQYGKPLTSATATEQMEFVDWQLKNSESRAGDKLRATDNAYDAGMVFGKHFERPKIVETSRGMNAREFANEYGSGISNSSLMESSVIRNATQMASEPEPEKESAISGFINDLTPDFTDVGYRIGFGLIALVLGGAGIFFLGSSQLNQLKDAAINTIT